MSRQDELYVPIIDQLSEGASDEARRLKVDLRLKLRDVAGIEAQLHGMRAIGRPTMEDIVHFACKIYDERRRRDKIFADHNIFGEPAWDMLLALFCLPARGENLCVSALTMASGRPQTTGLRYEGILRQKGLIERVIPKFDRRKEFVRLTQSGRDLMVRFLFESLTGHTPVPRYPDRAGTTVEGLVISDA